MRCPNSFVGNRDDQDDLRGSIPRRHEDGPRSRFPRSTRDGASSARDRQIVRRRSCGRCQPGPSVLPRTRRGSEREPVSRGCRDTPSRGRVIARRRRSPPKMPAWFGKTARPAARSGTRRTEPMPSSYKGAVIAHGNEVDVQEMTMPPMEGVAVRCSGEAWPARRRIRRRRVGARDFPRSRSTRRGRPHR
jgi:hypothetical protein